MTSLELIIFDCDGVLVDSEILTNTIFVNLLAEDGLLFSLDDFMKEFVGHTVIEAKRKMREQYKYQLTDEFVSKFYTAILKELALSLEPIQGIHEAIDKLNVPFCMASNGTPEKIEVMLKKTNLLDKFKGKMFPASLVANPKPAPDVYLLAAKTHNTPPANCLVIEDTSVGVTAAVSAGMTVFGFAAASNPKLLKEAGAKLTFSNMAELDDLIKENFDVSNNDVVVANMF